MEAGTQGGLEHHSTFWQVSLFELCRVPFCLSSCVVLTTLLGGQVVGEVGRAVVAFALQKLSRRERK